MASFGLIKTERTTTTTTEKETIIGTTQSKIVIARTDCEKLKRVIMHLFIGWFEF